LELGGNGVRPPEGKAIEGDAYTAVTGERAETACREGQALVTNKSWSPDAGIGAIAGVEPRRATEASKATEASVKTTAETASRAATRVRLMGCHKAQEDRDDQEPNHTPHGQHSLAPVRC
jgi:hypothetical protein